MKGVTYYTLTVRVDVDGYYTEDRWQDVRRVILARLNDRQPALVTVDGDATLSVVDMKPDFMTEGECAERKVAFAKECARIEESMLRREPEEGW